MVKRLFVDLDDTLVLWDSKGISWQSNAELINWIESYPGEVFVWSWGGEDYARKFVKTLDIKRQCSIIEKPCGKCEIEFFPGDMAVDDMPQTLFWFLECPEHLRIVSPFEDWDQKHEG